MPVAHPAAIGGIGGSGTRVGALLLQALGYYLGADLNESLDNLWFTLLFKRRSVLLETEEDLSGFFSLFRSRMSGRVEVSERERRRLLRLADRGRLQHAGDWLRERVTSFCNGSTSQRAGQAWGWKEPNTHIIINRLLGVAPDLRYVHIVRHPLEMAVSGNQNQLQLWGPAFLDRDVEIAPRDSLSYWCAAHRRILRIADAWPQRVAVVDIQELCADPAAVCTDIASFLGLRIADCVISEFGGSVRRPQSFGVYRSVDIRQFEPADLEYVAALGYPLP